MNSLIRSFVIYFALLIALVGASYNVVESHQRVAVVANSAGDFQQPQLKAGLYPWTVRSVDTQVVSKHWPKVTRSAMQEQVAIISSLGANFVAVGTPYDRVDELRLWSQVIHEAGLNVWFRSHWAEWEGDEGKPATLSPDEYLSRTSQFIKANPDLFVAGDSFTVAVEPEQVGVGLGKRFLTWDQYRNFLLSQVTVANDAFESIGLEGKIHTNWLSVNGWVVENQFTDELVDKLGLIVVDHFVGQTKTIGDHSDAANVARLTVSDLDRYHNRFKVPILLGEWGYQIFQAVPDDIQASVIQDTFGELSKRPYLVGVNYWVHMGNSASIIGDEYGGNLKPRQAAGVIRSFFNPISTTPFPKRAIPRRSSP